MSHVAFAALATLVLTAPPTQAGEIFSWNPRAAGLNGTAFTADALSFADYDTIVQAADNSTFTEAGYLPITGFSLAGQPVSAPGLNSPDGAGWGAHLRLTGSGPLVASALGIPEPVYTQLSYQIVGFNGLANYSFADSGAVVAGGATSGSVTLATGSLITADFAFMPSSDGLSIKGTIDLTVENVVPGLATGRLDVLSLAVDHPPSDYRFLPPSTIQVDAATGTSGSFSSAARVPEPASALLLGVGLIGIALRRKRHGT